MLENSERLLIFQPTTEAISAYPMLGKLGKDANEWEEDELYNNS